MLQAWEAIPDAVREKWGEEGGSPVLLRNVWFPVLQPVPHPWARKGALHHPAPGPQRQRPWCWP